MRRLIRTEKGFTFIETLIGLAILGMVGIVVLSGLAASAKSNVTDNNMSKAENLARKQLEYIQSLPYNAVIDPLNPTHPAYVTQAIPAGYNNFSIVTPVATRINSGGTVINTDSGLQKITITVKYNDKIMYTLVDYKVNR